MIHSATLVHDDVIDGANTRRGRPSTNARWGNHMSVLAGDWLYMQSFEMALRERNFAILDILIDLTQNMVEGELLQLTRLGRIDLTETEATELAYRKTACLFSGCARLGAVLGQAAEACRRGARRIRAQRGAGVSAGGRFARFHGVARTAGQAGAERFEGRQSDAAADFCAAEWRSAARWRWQRAFGVRRPQADRAKFSKSADFVSVRPEQITKLVRETGALDRAANLARDYVNRAKACLEELARHGVPPRAARRPRFHPRTRELAARSHCGGRSTTSASQERSFGRRNQRRRLRMTILIGWSIRARAIFRRIGFRHGRRSFPSCSAASRRRPDPSGFHSLSSYHL